MADHIGVDIEGVRGAVLRFERFPELARSNLLDRITTLTGRLADLIEANAPKKSGSLAQDIGSGVRQGDWGITGNVFMKRDYAKAGALNYGAHRATKVRLHMMGLDHFWARKLADPIRVAVKLHRRTPNIAATGFITGPAAAIHDEAIAEMTAAVEEAAAASETT